MRESREQDWIDVVGDESAAKSLWDLVGDLEPTEVVDVDAAWLRVANRVDADRVPSQQVARTRTISPRWLAVAASVALLLVAGWFALSGPSDVSYENSSAQVAEIRLPDATSVDLQPGAHLTVDFDGADRVVNLQGDASFAVERDPSRPFHVETSEFGVLVLGTTFDVNTSSNGSVVVVEGHVQVRGKSDSEWIDLFAGDAASISDGHAVASTVGRQDDRDSVSSDDLRFDGVALREVLKRVEHVTGSSFDADTELLDCPTTADFTDTEASDAANTLAGIFGAEVSPTDTGYRLIGGRCH